MHGQWPVKGARERASRISLGRETSESEDCKRLSERNGRLNRSDLQDERQAVNTVVDLRVSTVRQDAGRQRPTILKHARSEGLSVDAIARSGVT